MRKYLLILIAFAFSLTVSAEKLYWVGGSGNFNDATHWSRTSGGNGGAKVPTLYDDVLFNHASSKNGPYQVTLISNIFCKDFIVDFFSRSVSFVGAPNSKIQVQGEFILRNAANWNFNGVLEFVGEGNIDLNFGTKPINGDVVFNSASSNYQLKSSLILADNAKLYLNNGKLNIFNQSIKAGSLLKTTGAYFDLNLSNALLKIKEEVSVNNNLRVSSTNSQLNYDASKYNNNLVSTNVFSGVDLQDEAFLLPITSVVIVDSVTCPNACNGSLLVTFNGAGTGPYTMTFTAGAIITFNGIASSPFLATGLCGGNYTIRVYNSLGVQIGSAANNVVYEPSPMAVNYNTFDMPLCEGDCDGQFLFDVIGGNPTYSMVWNPGGVSFTGLSQGQEDSLENLCAGRYHVDITDRKGCILEDSFLIVEPVLMVANEGNTDQQCFGVCNAMAWVSPTDGTPFGAPQASGINYQVVWDGNPLLNNDTLYNLCPGTHTYVITDGNNCTINGSVTIDPKPDITYTSNGPTPLSCFDINDGTASVTAVSGGTAPYSFAWLGAPAPTVVNTATSSSATDMGVATYSVVITDALGCDDTATFVVIAPGDIVANALTTDVECFNGSDGTALASHVGGTAGVVTYDWYNSIGTPLPSGNPIITLSQGTYSLVATDINGCDDTITFTINEPPVLVVTASSTNPSCFGLRDGQVCGASVGGTGAIVFTFSPIVAGGVVAANCYNNLPVGNYVVTGTDANGCTATDNVTLTSPTQIDPDLTHTDPTCDNACNGTAATNASGGNGAPFTYVWSCDVSTASSITNQCAGSCTVTVRDALGCTQRDSVTFIDPVLLTVALSNTNVNCSGGNTAQITSVVGGGTPLYTYLWAPGGEVTPGLSNQVAGTYDVLVIDDNGCTARDTVIVTSPPAITITTTPINPTCFGDCDGSITTVLGGGTSPYTQTWLPNNSTNLNQINLCDGSYTIDVTDALGCTQSATIVLTEPGDIIVTTDTTLTTCIGFPTGTATANAVGGDGNYGYSWNPSGQITQTATGLVDGVYIVTVTDGQGCTGSALATVTEPTAVTVLVNSITPSCSNICNGTATIVPNGGTAPYTYTLDGGASFPGTSLTNLCTGNHTVVITDANGCTSSTNFVVPIQVTLTLTTSSTLLTCFGDCNGTITANVVGATGVPTFFFDAPGAQPDQNTNPATGLCAGIFTVTVTDAIGCQVTSTVTFTDPPLLSAVITESPVDCDGNCIGIATAAPAGGIAPYTVTWSNGPSSVVAAAGTSTNSNLCFGTYTATITDANGCTINPAQTANITQPGAFTVVSLITPPAICGTSNGSITVTPSGVGPYTYSWTAPGGATQTLSNIPAGVYDVTITDNVTGCDTLISFALIDPNGPTIDSDSTNVTCPGLNNGTITITVLSSTGVPTITFLPLGAPLVGSPQTAVGFDEGTHIVQITDATACQTFHSVTITEPDVFIANEVLSHVSCNGGSDGSITLNPTGGTAPFTYTVDGNADDNVMTGLIAGPHTVIPTDANGCTYSTIYNLTAPVALTLTEVHTNANCITGLASATITTAGGTAPFTFVWSGPTTPPNTANPNNLVQGTYTCDVTDGNGCTATINFTISQNPALVSGFTFTDNLCATGSSGTASFNASGGSLVYTYSWSHTGSLASSQNGISPGNYSATVSDNNGCSVTENYTIGAPTLLTVSLAGTDPLCNGAATGCITATPNGGTPVYSYVWTGAVSATQTVCNLTAGTYTVDVTDANGCVATQTLTLAEPDLLQGNVSSSQPTCFGTCNGILSSNPIGGVSPYTFFWGPAPSASVDDSLTGLCIGTYFVIVTDANGCEDSISNILTQPNQLGIAASTSPATCGLVPCNGVITINNIIGNTVEWLNSIPPGFTGLSQSNLCAGIYDIEVSDINGCKDTSQVLVSSDAGPVVNVDSTNTTCIGDCDGTLTVVSVVGIGPFTYSWQPGIADVDSIVTNLCDGSYISQVTDASGCITLTSIDILEPTDVVDNEVVTNASCNGVNNGSIILAPTGGTGALTYAWSNNPGLNSPNNIGIGPGSYTVDITDANLCTYQFIYNVGANAAVQYQLSVTNTSCFGQCDGTATLNNVGGGTAPYFFSWNDGQASASATALCAGNYSVTITDAAGCSILIDTTITEPTQIVANPTVTNTACGVCAGSVGLVPAGGTGAFTYLWGDGQSAATAINLCAGVHTVDVRDANGCLSQFNLAVNNTSGPTLTVNSTDVNCAGQCTGTASVVAAGGTTPYQYNWIAGGQTTSAVANLCAGTYFVQVKDADNCLVNDSVVINETNTIIANITATATNCGASTGQAIVAPSGGTAPYTFVWPDASTNDTISNLPAGTYSVEITDATSCKDTFFITINSANGPVVSVTTDSVSCFGLSDGSATLTINGGNPGYTVLWSTGSAANPTLNGLDAGNYSASVTDASSCVTAVNFTIDQPNSLALSLNNTQLPTCQAACNGALTAIPSGGTLPYTYLWVPGNQTTVSISNQCAGLYGLTVTDAEGCIVSQNTQLNNNPVPFTITEVKTDAACGVCDGTAALTPTGGQAPYTYLWSNGDITSNSSNLCAAVYMVDIEDALGCTQQHNVAINNTNGRTVTASSTDVTCSGLSNGTASTVVAGGTTPYQYNWINGGQVTSAVNGLSAGTYFVQVKDAANCLTNAQVTINETTILNANAVVTSATCGATDGSIDLTPTGGVAPYTFVWSAPLLPTEDQTNLAAGNFSVEITDAGGCKDTVFVSISSTNAPGVVVDVDSVSCNGLSDGSATLTINGGTPGYTVLWSTGSAADPTLSGLSAGNYAVSVTDAAGCVSAQNFTIEEPVQLALSLSNTQLPTCQAACNGVLTAIPNGGTLPYTYLWVPGNQTTVSISNQCAGLHGLTVTDARGCSISQNTQLVNNPNPFNITEVKTDATCGACDGTAILTPTGGQAPFTYLWSQGDTDSSAIDLCAGVYMVDIADAVGCTQQYNVAINNVNGPTVTASSTDVTCSGLADGTASTVVAGGTTPYQYNWINGGQITSAVNGLAAGTYFVQVKDAANCVTNAQVTINETTILNANAIVTSATCGATDGAIDLTPTGGVAPYTFVWSAPLLPIEDQTNLAAGNYSVEITDAGGCKDTVLVAISSTNAPGVVVDLDSVSCNGLSDGSATLTINGGTPGYTVSWSTGSAANPTLSGLSAGNYAVSVTDAAGCISSQNFTIEEPVQLALSLSNTQLPNCSGVCNGELTAIPNGGSLAYTYLWMPGNGTADTIAGLCAGSYTLTVTDANACVITQITNLNNNPVPFNIDTTIVSPSCNLCDGTIDLILIGGAAPYTYNWSSGDTLEDIANVCAGVYQVDITDTVGCSQTATFAISNLNGITNDVIVKTDESCFGTADGTVTVTPVGGTPGYTYLWPHNGATVNNLVGLGAGTYFLEIADTNNCIWTSQVDILSPNQMTATTSIVSPNCAVSDGSITLNVSGGTGTPSYVWNPAVAGNTNVATNLPAGVYTITVTDASAIPCSQDFTVTLSNTNGPQVDVLDSSMSCNGVCDGNVSLVVTSPNATGIVWNDASTGTSISNLCEGTYTAIITDLVLGCSTVISATITEPDTISFGVAISTDLRCFGICLGSIAAVPFGGTLPYTYAWAPSGGSISLVDSLCAGIHTLTITDNNGCIATQNTTLTEPTDIVTNGIVTDASCSSVPSGAIDVSVNGGSPFVGGNYTYQWIAGSAATTQDLNGVLFGNYSLEVTDSLLCKDTVSFNIATTDTVTANAGADAAFCLNGNVILDGSLSTVNNGTITYQWNEVAAGTLLGNTDSVNVTPTAGITNYQLVITNSLGCSDTDTVALTANALPVASAGPDLEVVYGISGTIGGSPTNPVGTTLVWTPSIDLSSTTIPNPLTTATLTTTYVVTVTDTATGCISQDSMQFVVLPDIIIPNGISPNGDGKNDTWIIGLITKFPDNEVEVYNRWGEQLYYKRNYDNTWDGTYKGKGLPVGTYYYVVKLNDPKYPEPYTGPITIFK
ncbi:MAG: gliding motility-associated C-terminal domain-containing protein [Bacteroidetes bacterium]|nr:gliding motility-associated C-terminal domain-containing protein [Bacteroidota bacterium]